MANGKCLPCPVGFESNRFYNSAINYNPFYCYRVYAGNYDFYTTSNKCTSLGVACSLVRIKSTTDYNYLIGYRNLYASTNFWVDSFRITLTDYKWGDGTALDYNLFCSDQPDSRK